MYRLLLFISLSFLFYSCGNQGAQQSADATPKNTDLAQLNLKGKVQTITESTYTADSLGKTDKIDSITTEYTFDEKGYLLKQVSKDQSGNVTEETTFTRNDKGSVTEFATTKKGKMASRLVTEIADDGLTYTGGKLFDSTGKQESYYTDLKVNEYGAVYAGKQHKMDSTLKSEWEGKYDQAVYIGGTNKDSSGKETFSNSIVLNDKRDPASETSTTHEKDSVKTEAFTYTYDQVDDKGNWIQRTAVKDGKTFKVVKRVIVYFKD